MKKNAYYRPDIDGLRALAVLAVVLFHLGIPGVSGGYVGVDVFFVISGYLVTGIIYRAVQNQQFSFADFYARRIRRLLPALSVVLACSTIATTLFFLPSDLTQFARSLSATQLFLANIFFWKTSGYFAAASELKPLLHMWSLAVEEQFYIFFPVVLVLLLRLPLKWVKASIMVASALSFLGCMYIMEKNMTAAFFLPMFRAWELLLGSSLALTNPEADRNLAPKNLWLPLIVGGCGLLCILWPISFYSEDTDFPGVSALLPTLGAAILIHVGQRHPFSLLPRIMSLRPVVFLGLISYSLYLWHWPIIVLYKYVYDGALDWRHILLLLCAMISIAAVSWRFIEVPFRNITRSTFWTFSAWTACSSIFLIISSNLIFHKGIPSRFDETVLSLDSVRTVISPFEACFSLSPQKLENQEFCTVGTRSSKPTSMIWGDSHSLALLPALDSALKKRGMSAVYAGMSACPPLFDVANPNKSGISKRCLDLGDAVKHYLTSNPNIKTVLLSSVWNFYSDDDGPYKLIHREETLTRNSLIFPHALSNTLSFMHERKIKVIIFEHIPPAIQDVPFVMAKNRAYGRPLVPQFQEDTLFFTNSARTRQIFATAQEKAPFHAINLAAYLCREKHCRIRVEDSPLYRDPGHLSVLGALYVLPYIQSEFAKIGF